MYAEYFNVPIYLMVFFCFRHEDDLPPTPFKRSSPANVSRGRVSIRGETYRSSMIARHSLRSRKNPPIKEGNEV